MSQKGSLIVRTYASSMIIPVVDSNVFITQKNGEEQSLLAFRRTDENGKTQIVEINAPDVENSQSSDSTGLDFSTVDIKIEKTGYEIVVIRDVQIFSGQLSIQNVEMVPLPEGAVFDEHYEIYTVTPQDL